MPEISIPHAPTVQPSNAAVAAPQAIAAVTPATNESDGGADFAAVLRKQLQQPSTEAGKPEGPTNPASADAVKQDENAEAALRPDLATLLPGLAQLMQPLMSTAPTAKTTDLAPANATPTIKLSATNSLPATPALPLLTAAGELAGKIGSPSLPAAAPAFFAVADKLMAEAADQPANTTAAPVIESFSDVLGNAAILQAPASQTHATAEAPAPAQLNTPVGTHGWDNEVAQKVVWLSNRQESRAELTLTPAHLGKIEITLTTHGDQTNAIFVSASPTVRDALEQALPRLRELLADAGITLGQSSVNAESARQEADERDGNGRGGRRGDGSVQAVSAPTQWIRRSDGLVDTFA